MGASGVYDSALTKIIMLFFVLCSLEFNIANGQLLSFIRFQFLASHCIDFRMMLLWLKMLKFKNNDGLGDAFFCC